MHRVLAPVAASLVVAACAIGIVLAAVHRDSSPAHNAAPALTVPAATLASADRAAMSSYGDTLVVASAAEAKTAARTSSSAALRAVPAYFGFLADSRVVSATLGRLTDAKYGEVHATKTGTAVTPYISNRLVWLFVFDHFSTPVAGPRNPAGGGLSQDTSATSRMWVAVDATTGDVLGGRSITSGG